MPVDAAIYPVGLVVRGRRCLVVGGGRVAARKIAGLVRCGAAVTVVAPEVHEAVRELGVAGVIATVEDHPIAMELRAYVPGEAGSYALVVAATGDPAVDGAVCHDAEQAGVWVNSADDPDHCSFVLPAVTRDGVVTVAVSTGGASPALARWLRDRVARALGPNVGELAAVLAEGRARVQHHGLPTEAVDWGAVLDGPLPDLVRSGHVDEARRVLDTHLPTELRAKDTTSEPRTRRATQTDDTGGTAGRDPSDAPPR